VVGDAGITVDAGDVEALAEAMRTVLQDPHTAAAMRATGLARAATFTWQGAAHLCVAAYRRALMGGVAARAHVAPVTA
jgi:glycosyltransferase involved in cell wall biosynthesis